MANRTCSIIENGIQCERTGKIARDMCSMHYTRWRRTGDPLIARPHRGSAFSPTDWIKRFWSSVDKDGENGCWLWTRGRNEHGYGVLDRKSGSGLAHRYSWELANGPIPTGLQVLHRCDNPPCVNPEHLFLGTRLDNMADMTAKGRHWCQLKTHCKWGHPYDARNTRFTKKGTRRCRECHRLETIERRRVPA